MKGIGGEQANKFVAWLAIASKFLPKSMSIDEASNIFLRYQEDLKNVPTDAKTTKLPN